jgi:type III secretion system chaperone SycN
MNWVHETLAEYGLQLGLGAWSLGRYGVAQLELQAGGLLAVEPVQSRNPEVLVYLGRPLGFDGATVLRNALVRAHHSTGSALPVQVAVRGEGPDALLLVIVRVPEREFTIDTLSRMVEYLSRWSDGARNGH